MARKPSEDETILRVTSALLVMAAVARLASPSWTLSMLLLAFRRQSKPLPPTEWSWSPSP